MKEVAVIKRLQTQIVKLQISLRLQSRTQALQIELLQSLVKQLVFNAFADEARKILNIVRSHLSLRHLLTNDFLANRVQQ